MSRQLIILAGGAGTRLRARLGDLPKPMIPVAGKPLLEHQVELAKKFGFTDLIFFVHYRADLIEQYFGDGKKFGVQIRYVLEKEPLGTAGAVLAGFEHLAERFVVLYGDTMVNVDLDRIWNAHEKAEAAATLLIASERPSVRFRFGGSGCGDARRGVSQPAASAECLAAKSGERRTLRSGKIRAGEILSDASANPENQPNPAISLDFGKDIFPAMVRAGEKLLGYNSPEFIKDIGTPERYDKISAQFAAGIVQRSSLATPQRAVFLDRDGTLNVDKDCLRNADELELLPGVAEAMHELNLHGWRTVVVTNQPVIAKGFCSEAELQNIHNKLESLLGLRTRVSGPNLFLPASSRKRFSRRAAGIENRLRLPQAKNRHD